MTIMNKEEKSADNPKDAPKKTCPRAARENIKKKSEVNSWKTAHTGLRFHIEKTQLVTHDFSSVSKSETVTRSRIQGKSVQKQENGEGSKTTDTKNIEVLMDTLKISKSEVSSTREKSPARKGMPMSPVVERLTSKKGCTRCSRCSKSPKVEKTEVKPPLKVAKKQDLPRKTIKKENHAVKTVKLETSQSAKTVTCKKQFSKLAKRPEEPQDKTLKPKSILKHSSSGDNETSNCERTLSAEKLKSCSVDKGKSTNEEKPEFAWPNSGKPENVTSTSEASHSDSHDKEKPEILNGSEHPSVPDTKACLMNGTRHDEHVCDPHFGSESPDIPKKEIELVKSASKIPRKTQDAMGPKSDASVNKVTIPQPLILEA